MISIVARSGDVEVSVTVDAPYSPDVYDDAMKRAVAGVTHAHTKFVEDYVALAPHSIHPDCSCGI